MRPVPPLATLAGLLEVVPDFVELELAVPA
jgi:hypothetical protein